MFPPCYLIWGNTMVKLMKIMTTSFQRFCACIAVLWSPDPAPGHCWPTPLLDIHRQVWISLLWDHCPFLLGPSAHKVLFVPTKSQFPQACLSSGSSMVGLMVTSNYQKIQNPARWQNEILVRMWGNRRSQSLALQKSTFYLRVGDNKHNNKI